MESRLAYTKELNRLSESSAELRSISPSQILEVRKGIAENISLFSSQLVFCVENLEKYGFKKSTKTKTDEIYDAILHLSQDKSVVVLDYEEGKQARLLKLKDIAIVRESKPATSIFKLLDDCVPGVKNSFIKSLRDVCSSQDEQFVFIMLYRHIRQLLFVLMGGSTAKLPPWQKYKIIAQANKWEKQKLLDFYTGLMKIEINSKTSSDPYGIAKSLEILVCHYL